MRTTLQIDDDVLAAARALADAEGRSVGHIVSELARRGLLPRDPRKRGKLPEFAVPGGTPVMSPDTVRRALEDE